MLSYRIAVTWGLNALDALARHGINATAEDENVYVNIANAEKAIAILKTAKLLRTE